jgi:hypothetical protein
LVFWLFRDRGKDFGKAAIFEKYLPLMREAARNDYSSVKRWMAFSFRTAAYFGGGGAKPPPENRFRGTAPAWMAGASINTWRVIYDN